MFCVDSSVIITVHYGARVAQVSVLPAARIVAGGADVTMSDHSEKSDGEGGEPESQLVLTFDLPNGTDLDEASLFKDGWQAPRRSQLSVTYFDAPGRPLETSNAFLGIERRGRRYCQRLETDASKLGAATLRHVWNDPTPSADPVISRVPDCEIQGLMDGRLADEFTPLCRTDIKCTTRRMRMATGGEITAAIDVGEMIADSAKRHFGQLTLKTASGPRHLLFETALQIARSAPLRIAGEPPVKRLLGLMAGQTPKSRKAGTLYLSEDATVEDALAHMAQSCIDHILANQVCLLESEDPEGVHQMRVAMRRFRSMLRIFRPLLPPDQRVWLGSELKFLAEQLAPARDWDVFAEEIAGKAATAGADRKAFETFQERLNACRERSRDAVRAAIGSPRYTTFLLRASAWLARSAWRDQPLSETSALLFGSIRDFAGDALSELHRPVCKAGRNFESLPTNDRHKLRLRVKRLRYATEFFSSIYPGKAIKRYGERLSGLQDALGYLNDVAVAEHLVHQVCESCSGADLERCRFAGGVIIGWHNSALADSEQTLVKSVRAFARSGPFWRQSSRTDARLGRKD